MIRSPHDPIGRRALPHDPPHFIGTSNAIFFMTICCQPKGTNHLCHSQTAKILFDATRFYQEQHYWGVPLLGYACKFWARPRDETSNRKLEAIYCKSRWNSLAT